MMDYYSHPADEQSYGFQSALSINISFQNQHLLLRDIRRIMVHV